MHIGVSPNGSSTQYRMLLCTHTHVTDDVPYYDCTRTLLMHAQDTYIFIADRCWIHSISPPTGGKQKKQPREEEEEEEEGGTNNTEEQEPRRRTQEEEEEQEQERGTNKKNENQGGR